MSEISETEIKAMTKEQNYIRGYKDGYIHGCKNGKSDILDKIKSEIKEVQTYKMFEGEDTVHVERNDVLAIIDKYKAESEE